MDFKNEPISNIKWFDSRTLNANDYNPNTVLNKELELLRFSILTTGWVQPVLIGSDMVIIDGFHRSWLSANDSKMIQKYNYFCPCVEMDLSPEQRMLLTIRINRAKGVHSALKMHEIVTKVVKEYGMSPAEVAQNIGATMDEINLLMQEGVFSALNIREHKYSKAWTPKK